MPYEELPEDIAAFFSSGGELPESLKPAPVEAVATPAPAPTPAPEAVVDAPAPAPTPAPAGDPYAARLIADRDAQIKQLSDSLADLKAKIERANEPAAPDPNTDPLGHLTHQFKTLQKQLDTLIGAQTEQATMTVQERQAQAFFAKVNGDIADFKGTHADYDKAYEHLVKMRTQDYIDMGMTREEAGNAMGQEEMQIVQRALHAGKNPGAVAYGMAQRYGYKAPAPTPAPENKLDTIKKGIAASETVKSGNPPEVDVSLENLETLSDSALNKQVEDNWEGLFGKKKGIFG